MKKITFLLLLVFSFLGGYLLMRKMILDCQI